MRFWHTPENIKLIEDWLRKYPVTGYGPRGLRIPYLIEPKIDWRTGPLPEDVVEMREIRLILDFKNFYNPKTGRCWRRAVLKAADGSWFWLPGYQELKKW